MIQTTLWLATLQGANHSPSTTRANTIIIDRADRIGLSDLYQLRGRVGRSNLQAYAYFLIPGADIVTEEAKKRLQAISEMSYLGAGFRLAMKDLEIRGAGNLLGPQQSGHVHAVGFDMYVEMLEKAVAEVKGVEIREEFEPTISLKVSALIPENYVEDLSIRLSLYRRIANARDNAELEDLRSEMRDSFGGCPDEFALVAGWFSGRVAAVELVDGTPMMRSSASTKSNPSPSGPGDSWF